jgi:prepilin-type N-terminal cleavage/methylation domain-containing protein
MLRNIVAGITGPKYGRRAKRAHGFTLIELLIVIAIILILIAIALPNFLEAQIRARVTKVKSELRSIHLAMDSYYLDWGIYPAEHERDTRFRLQRGLEWLTSPNAYIASLPEDPFSEFGADKDKGFVVTYETGGLEPRNAAGPGQCGSCMVTWMIFSNGPDQKQDIGAEEPTVGQDVRNYAATNGTKSVGSIYRWGGDPWWIGIQVSMADKRMAKTAPTPGLQVDGQFYVHRLPPF